MSTIGKKRFYDHSSADEERNEKRVHKRQNTGRKGRYSAKNKAAWSDHLLQSLESQLLENKISYLNKPSEVQAIKAKIPDPVFVTFIPSLTKPIEEPHEKEVKDMRNDVIKKLYTDALSRQISKLEKLQLDNNEVRLSILLDLVDKAIHDELHDFKNRTCASMNPEQQFEAVFQNLLMTHGPHHSSLDVRSLTAQLSELSPTALGWPKFLLSFNHGVTTLTEMKQTDPLTGATLRGPKPAPVPVPHQVLTGDRCHPG
jgi:hypothetical protein